MATHVVTNQVPPLRDHNPASSPVLMEALVREGGGWGADEITELGALSGSDKAQRWGELAYDGKPLLRRPVLDPVPPQPVILLRNEALPISGRAAAFRQLARQQFAAPP